MANKFIAKLAEIFSAKSKSVPSAQSQESINLENIDFQTTKGKKMLYTIYRRHPAVFHATKLRATLTLPSIEIKTKSPAAKKVVDNFYKNLHPVSGNVALLKKLRDLSEDTDIFGNGFIEPIWNKAHDNYLHLKKLHPISIDLKRKTGEGSEVDLDKLGNPKAWSQGEYPNSTELPMDSILHFTYNRIGDEILGISTLEPIYKTVHRLMNIEEGIATAIFRHGFPLYDITVEGSSPNSFPAEEQINKAAEQVKGLNYKSEFIHPPNYKVKLMEAYSLGKGRDYTINFIDNIASATGLPKFMLMGTAKELSRASAESLLKMIKPVIQPMQDDMKLFVEMQILKPLMDANGIDETPEVVIGDWPILDVEYEAASSAAEGKDKKKKDKDGDGEIKPSETSEPIEPEKMRQELSKKKGIYLLPNQAKMFSSGEKRSIVLPKSEARKMKNKIGKEISVFSDSGDLAVVKLREPREIDANEFIQLEYAHKISNDERKQLWPDESIFYIYEFDVIKKE